MSLPEGLSGSGFLHGLLLEASERYRDVFAPGGVPEEGPPFRRNYGELLVRFEAQRVTSPRRAEIARFIVDRAHELLCFSSGRVHEPLDSYFARAAAPAILQEHPGSGRGGLEPAASFRGKHYSGGELGELAERLLDGHLLTRAAAIALDWVAGRGEVDLTGHKFVLLGAGAELAPTPLLLSAGATVLWVDLQDPAPLLEQRERYSGTLVVAPEATDLLREPGRVAATIREFAGPDPVHVGLFAYAPGQSREWRLAAAMNAILRQLDCVRSVSLFVSPTSPLVLEPEDVAALRERGGQRPAWQTLLSGLRVLDASGPFECEGIQIPRSIVSLQGTSYQAAQYVCKILQAELCASEGVRAGTGPVTVSANVAGISDTRSMKHPVFQAAFLGASAFDLQIFEPETTRCLSGLLVLHDLLNPDAPGHVENRGDDTVKRLARLFCQQIHGGLYAQPHAIEPAIRIAALLGLLRRPSLLLDLF